MGMKCMLRSRLSKGFTLLESALVIVVAAAVITMAVSSFSTVQTRKKETITQQQLNTLYQAALKAPNVAATNCGVDNKGIGKVCLGLPTEDFINPWKLGNSVTIEGTQIVLRSSLPDNAICKALLERFVSLQTSSDRTAATGANTCKRGSDNEAERNLEVRISLYQ